ncbi:hypothetical protein [Jiulongibacter sediminis]|uniref:hypothetical protein n=1 Tax=Jiulongibacter sediminis TaxID=1605367 RepID=UPI001040DB44|nr:hypothetical protein [Jiulongibacter sediminis]
MKLNNPNPPTGLPAQMSDGWIDYVAGRLNDEGKTSVSNMIILNKNKLTKYVSAIDRTKGELNILKLGNYDL